MDAARYFRAITDLLFPPESLNVSACLSTAMHQASVGSEDREFILSRLLTKLNTLWVASTYPFAGKGRKLSLHHACEISRCFAPHIRLGNCVEIGRQTWLFTWPTPGVQGNDEVKIILEDNCCIAERCTITAGNSIHLERDVVLASDVLLMDHAHAYEDVTRPIGEQGTTPGGRIRIEQGCRIGQGAAILCSNKGEVVLGRNCWVAPRAVVTRSFPPGSVLAGNPARAVRKSGTMPARAEQETISDAEIEPAKQGG